MSVEKFDLVVLGSGPAGEKGAAAAAYFGKKVALIEKENVLGGAAANTGTLPSKTLREKERKEIEKLKINKNKLNEKRKKI